MTRRIITMLVLLLGGSASLVALTDGPFGVVNPHDFYGSMSLTVKVQMNGNVLEDIVPAVFSGSLLRGKGEPSEQKPGVYFITVCGDQTGEPLYFKILTEGRVIEVDDGLKFTLNGITGSPGNPYVINLPAPVVTTPTTEGWATTCLPFSAEVPEGVTVWNATGIADGELLMTKATGTILPANTPVLLQSTGLGSYEWLSRVADGDIVTTGSIFAGTTEPTAIAANSVLTLGYSNEGNHEIGFWRFTGTTIPANRAYIEDYPAGVRGVTFRMDEVTGISTANRAPIATNRCYDLQGRRIANAPFSARPKDASRQRNARLLNSRLYIINGLKVVIK